MKNIKKKNKNKIEQLTHSLGFEKKESLRISYT